MIIFSNIEAMRAQLDDLSCSFNWDMVSETFLSQDKDAEQAISVGNPHYRNIFVFTKCFIIKLILNGF